MATPDTLRRWLKKLIKEKWTFESKARKGRPPIDPETEELIVNLLKANPTWGSDSIVGVLSNLGIKVSDTTIDNIRKRNGIPPAPEREKKGDWNKFLTAHWEGVIAADFFSTEVLCRSGLLLFVCPSTRHEPVSTLRFPGRQSTAYGIAGGLLPACRS
mgnify:FL=1